MGLEDSDISGVRDEVIWFKNWGESLADTQLPEVNKLAYRKDILGLLRVCKSHHCPLSTALIRWYLSRKDLTAGAKVRERESFRWLYQTARQQGRIKPTKVAYVPPILDASTVINSLPQLGRRSSAGLPAGWLKRGARLECECRMPNA